MSSKVWIFEGDQKGNGMEKSEHNFCFYQGVKRKGKSIEKTFCA